MPAVTRRGDYPALKQRGAFEATGKIPRCARDDRIHYDVVQLTVVSQQLQSLHAAAFPLQGGASLSGGHSRLVLGGGRHDGLRHRFVEPCLGRLVALPVELPEPLELACDGGIDRVG